MTEKTYEQTRELFSDILRTNTYVGMCECSDMINTIIALDRQIPKTVRETKNTIVCPTCGTLVGSSPYCRYCGQKLSWK